MTPSHKFPIRITYNFSREDLELILGTASPRLQDLNDLYDFMTEAIVEKLDELAEKQEIKKELEEEEREAQEMLRNPIKSARAILGGGMIPGGEVRPTQPPPKPPDAEKRFKERAEAQGYRVTNLPPPDDDNPMTKEMFDADYNPIKAAVRMMRTMPKMLNWDEHDTKADPEEYAQLARDMIGEYSFDVTQEGEVGGKNEGDVTAGKGLEKPVPISVQLERDRAIYGVSFEEDGERVNPEEVRAHLATQCSHPCLLDQKCDNPDWCRLNWCHLAHTEAGAILVDERSQDPGPAEDGPHAHPMGKEDGE